MLNCQEITRLCSASQERRLTFKERMGVRLHILLCVGCRNFNQQLGVLRRIARTYVKQAHIHKD